MVERLVRNEEVRGSTPLGSTILRSEPMLPHDRLWPHVVIVFAVALTVYVVGFAWLEHRRTRLGPWEITFVKEEATAARIVIDQPALRITNVQIEFTTAVDLDPTNAAVEFVAGRKVPFAVPFGECVFMDPLFLPGTVTLDLLEHRVEVLPRMLSVDGTQYHWTSNLHIDADVTR